MGWSWVDLSSISEAGAAPYPSVYSCLNPLLWHATWHHPVHQAAMPRCIASHLNQGCILLQVMQEYGVVWVDLSSISEAGAAPYSSVYSSLSSRRLLVSPDTGESSYGRHRQTALLV